MPQRRLDHSAYRVGWICPLEVEQIAAMAMLDEEHEPLPQKPTDHNIYKLGSINKHNLVIAGLPQTGNCSAATVVTQMRMSFPKLRYGLLVGIGGGVPTKTDSGMIRLGHVVVSKPTGVHSGAVQYDHGKAKEGHFERTGAIAPPPPILLNAAQALAVQRERLDCDPVWEDAQRTQKNRRTTRRFAFPGLANDHLYPPNYIHRQPGESCDECACDPEQRVGRQVDDGDESFVVVHRGTIASGELVVKNAALRDQLAEQHGLLCFEMEAAGALSDFPCLVIRGISDYCDSHKNDAWHGYAAAAAAAYARQLFFHLPEEEMQRDCNAPLHSTVSQHWQKDEKYDQIMKALHETDPRDDKTRIQDAKGGLLRDSYHWILEHDDFRKWRIEPQSQLLWIKGDPGKGKTMLLCGIIDELEKDPDNCLSYFFCQATDTRLSNATAVLRGLIYLLVARKPSLISYVREKYDHGGKQAFEDVNAWEALSKILTSITNDPSLDGAILVIDALDECQTNRHQLLDFMKRPSRVKWVVSGRNWQEIEERVGSTKDRTWLSLELNQDSISKAVQTYIDHKVDELAQLKTYKKSTKDTIRDYLSANADGTFLWVALVCQKLGDPHTRSWQTLDLLKEFPSGLGDFYGRMMEHILTSSDVRVFMELLAIASVVYRPIALEELKVLIESLGQDHLDYLPEIIKACGSFLTLREDVLYFVHQSAKDFLLDKGLKEILPNGAAHRHYAIFSKSRTELLNKLERNICKLGSPGFRIDQVSPRHLDTLTSLNYSCVFWVDHLHDSDPTTIKDALQDDGDVHGFIRDKYLYWLELLSLLRSIPEGIKAVHRLEALARDWAGEQLIELLHDARRFILYNKTSIEIAPLQTYASALVFSPEQSPIRVLFRHEEPNWMALKPRMEIDWNACLQTLEGHSSGVSSVVFSADGQRLASGSNDKTVKIWDPATGKLLQTLEGHSSGVSSVVFSADGQRLVSGSYDKTVKIWDPATGKHLQTLKGHSSGVSSVVFSADGQRLASGSNDKTVKIWDPATGKHLQTLYIGRPLHRLSFDPTSSVRLSTEIGLLDLEMPDPVPNPNPQLGEYTPQSAAYVGYGFSDDSVWMMKDQERVLWLPPEYRPGDSAIEGSNLAIGCRSGRVLLMKFL